MKRSPVATIRPPLGRVESLQLAGAMGLQQSGLGPVEPGRLWLEPGLVQRRQGESRKQGSGIHVVLHHGIGQHHIPLPQGRSAAPATPVNTSRSMLGSLASRRGGPCSAHLAPAAPGQAEAHAVAPRTSVDPQVAMVAAAQILEVAEVSADLLRHGAQQAEVQRLRHGFVNLEQP